MVPADLVVTREALLEWGERLGATLAPGDVVTLRGALGAGKTTLAQGIARGFGVREAVTSPTYNLVHRYEGTRGVLWHLDLYRIGGVDELPVLGWDDLFAGDATVVVEWPERAGNALPVARADVELTTVAGDVTSRRLVAR